MIVIKPAQLCDIVETICRAGGSSQEEAAHVAEHLVGANLAGHDSHGVGMIPTYVSSLQRGKLVPNASAKVLTDRGPVLVVDGCRGYGQVVARQAMAMAIERARQHGVCVLALRNAHHIGRVGAWGEQAVAAGLVSVHFVNVIGHQALVAPFGGSDGRLLTNPFCVSIPAENGEPIVLDMATSKVALGKVRVAMNEGRQVDAGILIDNTGRPTTDPNVMFRNPPGAVLPIGEHKGYGLAMICEVMAGVLGGGGTVNGSTREEKIPINNMLAIVLDPTAFTEGDFFHTELESLRTWVKGSPPAPGVDKVLVPGDPERQRRGERNARGIPIDDTTWQQLLDAAATVGVSSDIAAAWAAAPAPPA